MPNFAPLLRFLVALVCCLSGFSYAKEASAPNKIAHPTEIHVGIYAPFSNEQAFVGRNILGAMQLARDHVTEAKIKYRFYTLDKSSESPVTARTLQKFIDIHHIQVLLTESTESGLMAAPVARQNNIIHFCMASDSSIADGKNNYVAWNESYQQSSVLDEASKAEFVAQYVQTYESHPVTQAGYAFDVFNVVNQSAVLAMKAKPAVLSDKIAEEMHTIATAAGLMGAMHPDQKGVLYAHVKPEKNPRTRVG